MPAADVAITVALARSLVAAQHGDLAAQPIEPFAAGWDNEVLRLGDGLLIRLPRRASAAALLENELGWLATVAPHCSLPTPVPVRRGVPAADYPYPWSIVPWLPGEPVGDALLEVDHARQLGRFVRGLHVEAPSDAPRNPLRGIPLADRQERFERALATVADRVDAPRIRETWARCVAAPRWTGPAVWLHGDLHALNVLWDRERITGVIDFGDLGAGDPATDLMIAFMAFDEPARRVFLDEAGADPAMIERGRGWAIALGLVFAASGDPALAGLGHRAIAAAT